MSDAHCKGHCSVVFQREHVRARVQFRDTLAAEDKRSDMRKRFMYLCNLGMEKKKNTTWRRSMCHTELCHPSRRVSEGDEVPLSKRWPCLMMFFKLGKRLTLVKCHIILIVTELIQLLLGDGGQDQLCAFMMRCLSWGKAKDNVCFTSVCSAVRC